MLSINLLCFSIVSYCAYCGFLNIMPGNMLEEIINHFTIEGKFAAVAPIGSGHINDSYLVTTSPPEAPDYVLQRINHHIFKDVPGLTNNILRVTRHLKQRLETRDRDLGWFRVIGLVPATDGGYFHRDKTGGYWRMYDHVRNSRSFDIVKSPDLAREAGKAFGLFQYLSSDMVVARLSETLPDFHHVEKRLATFRDTVMRDPAGRAGEVRGEIAFAEERAAEMHAILRLGQAGKLPLRVTHNDTKCNNVLFDENDRAIAVVDLDTVMPGYILYDFGDAIRTGASTGAEDEPDLSKVGIDLELFRAYARGYLSFAGSSLAREEVDQLAFSARYMTWLIGLRFLTDHIDGDRYFKTGFPGHNLQRARAQFRLLQSMEGHFAEMQAIIHENN